MAEKLNWCVVGDVKLLGIGGKVHRKEYTHAVSRSQALLRIAKRLSEEYRQDVYLGDCDVYQVSKKRKDGQIGEQKPDKKKAVYQLDLFSSVSQRVA